MPERALNIPDRNSVKRIRRQLLAWYDRKARDLPWRKKRPVSADPYHVLVSEAMLQQTQVATVVPYFERFINRYPTVASLAAADEQSVLTAWQGLGYYRRALNLHRASRVIVSEYGGNLPDDFDAIRGLPGVGRYTAGAISSIVFNQSRPILDGNVTRVLSRLFEVEEPVTDKRVQAYLWELAGVLVPSSRGRPGDFNQAMMELGALVCTKSSPVCVSCPLAGICQGRVSGKVELLPVRSAGRSPRVVHHYAVAAESGERFLFHRRSDVGLWAGMWELPTYEENDRGCGSGVLDKWLDGLKLKRIGPMSARVSFRHQTTHRTIVFNLLHVPVRRAFVNTRDRQWRKLDDLSDLPLSNPQRRMVAYLKENDIDCCD